MPRTERDFVAAATEAGNGRTCRWHHAESGVTGTEAPVGPQLALVTLEGDLIPATGEGIDAGATRWHHAESGIDIASHSVDPQVALVVLEGRLVSTVQQADRSGTSPGLHTERRVDRSIDGVVQVEVAVVRLECRLVRISIHSTRRSSEHRPAPRPVVQAVGTTRRQIGCSADLRVVRRIERNHRAVVAVRCGPDLEVDVSDTVVVVTSGSTHCTYSLTRRDGTSCDRAADVSQCVAPSTCDVHAEVAVAGLVVVHRAIDRCSNRSTSRRVVTPGASQVDAVLRRSRVRGVVVAPTDGPRRPDVERRQDVARRCRRRRRHSYDPREHKAHGDEEGTDARERTP